MLTERLAAIADEIEKGESVADIGTDQRAGNGRRGGNHQHPVQLVRQ